MSLTLNLPATFEPMLIDGGTTLWQVLAGLEAAAKVYFPANAGCRTTEWASKHGRERWRELRKRWQGPVVWAVPGSNEGWFVQVAFVEPADAESLRGDRIGLVLLYSVRLHTEDVAVAGNLATAFTAILEES